MSSVNVRELRNHGGDVLARVEAGAELDVVRAGRVVGVLSPVRRPAPRTSDLIEWRRTLPRMDAAALREDIDQIVDQSL
jgi:antitoxin (DNA-binding transcriptional repressor) of toxin-antitoxin stability system